MTKDIRYKTRSDDLSDSDIHNKWWKTTVGFLRDWNTLLNYFVTEHWLVSLLFAIPFLAIVSSILAKIGPRAATLFGAMILGVVVSGSALLVWVKRNRALKLQSISQPKIASELKETFQRLRQSLESLALQSNGLFHVLVERQHGRTVPDVPAELPPDLSMQSGPPGTKAVFHFGSLPGDSARIRELSSEESSTIPADAKDRMYFRDHSGHAWGVLEAAVIRNDYIHGDRTIFPKFQALADGLGAALHGVPNNVLARLPANIQPLFRPRMRIDRRYRFGDFPWEPIPIGCLARDWNPAAIQFEHGIIIDFPDSSTGTDRPLSAWMLLVHRLGWEAKAGSPFCASKWFWLHNVSASADMLPKE